jgi:hypothetical protein
MNRVGFDVQMSMNGFSMGCRICLMGYDGRSPPWPATATVGIQFFPNLNYVPQNE